MSEENLEPVQEGVLFSTIQAQWIRDLIDTLANLKVGPLEVHRFPAAVRFKNGVDSIFFRTEDDILKVEPSGQLASSGYYDVTCYVDSYEEFVQNTDLRAMVLKRADSLDHPDALVGDYDLHDESAKAKFFRKVADDPEFAQVAYWYAKIVKACKPPEREEIGNDTGYDESTELPEFTPLTDEEYCGLKVGDKVVMHLWTGSKLYTINAVQDSAHLANRLRFKGEDEFGYERTFNHDDRIWMSRSVAERDQIGNDTGYDESIKEDWDIPEDDWIPITDDQFRNLKTGDCVIQHDAGETITLKIVFNHVGDGGYHFARTPEGAMGTIFWSERNTLSMPVADRGEIGNDTGYDESFTMPPPGPLYPDPPGLSVDEFSALEVGDKLLLHYPDRPPIPGTITHKEHIYHYPSFDVYWDNDQVEPRVKGSGFSQHIYMGDAVRLSFPEPTERGEIGNDTGYDESIQESDREFNKELAQLLIKAAKATPDHVAATQIKVWPTNDNLNVMWNSLHDDNASIHFYIPSDSAEAYVTFDDREGIEVEIQLPDRECLAGFNSPLTKILPFDHVEGTELYNLYEIVRAYVFPVADRGEIGHDTGYDESLTQALAHCESIDPEWWKDPRNLGQGMSPEEFNRLKPGDKFVYCTGVTYVVVQSATGNQWGRIQAKPIDPNTPYRNFYAADDLKDMHPVPVERGDIGHDEGYDESRRIKYETFDFTTFSEAQLRQAGQAWANHTSEEFRRLVSTKSTTVHLMHWADPKNNLGLGETVGRFDLNINLEENLAQFDFQSAGANSYGWKDIKLKFELTQVPSNPQVIWNKIQKYYRDRMPKLFPCFAESYTEFLNLLIPDERGEIGNDRGYDESINESYDISKVTWEHLQKASKEWYHKYPNSIGFCELEFAGQSSSIHRDVPQVGLRREGKHSKYEFDYNDDEFHVRIIPPDRGPIATTLWKDCGFHYIHVQLNPEYMPDTPEGVLEGVIPEAIAALTPEIIAEFSESYKEYLKVVFPAPERGEIGHDTGYDESVEDREPDWFDPWTDDAMREVPAPAGWHKVTKEEFEALQPGEKVGIVQGDYKYPNIKTGVFTGFSEMGDITYGDMRSSTGEKGSYFPPRFCLPLVPERSEIGNDTGYDESIHSATIDLSNITVDELVIHQQELIKLGPNFSAVFQYGKTDVPGGWCVFRWADDGNKALQLELVFNCNKPIQTMYINMAGDSGFKNDHLEADFSKIPTKLPDSKFALFGHDMTALQTAYRQMIELLVPPERGDIGHDLGYDESLLREHIATVDLNLEPGQLKTIAAHVQALGPEYFTKLTGEKDGEAIQFTFGISVKLGKCRFDIVLNLFPELPEWSQISIEGRDGASTTSNFGGALFVSFHEKFPSSAMPGSLKDLLGKAEPEQVTVLEELYQKMIGCFRPAERGEIGHDLGYDESVQNKALGRPITNVDWLRLKPGDTIRYSQSDTNWYEWEIIGRRTGTAKSRVATRVKWNAKFVTSSLMSGINLNAGHTSNLDFHEHWYFTKVPERSEIGNDTGYDESIQYEEEESYPIMPGNAQKAKDWLISQWPDKVHSAGSARIWFRPAIGSVITFIFDEANASLVKIWLELGSNFQVYCQPTSDIPLTLEDLIKRHVTLPGRAKKMMKLPNFRELKKGYDGFVAKLTQVPERGEIGNDTGYDESIDKMTKEEFVNLKIGDRFCYLPNSEIYTVIRGGGGMSNFNGPDPYIWGQRNEGGRVTFSFQHHAHNMQFLPAERGDIGNDTGYDESIAPEEPRKYYAIVSGNGNDGVSRRSPEFIAYVNDPWAFARIAAIQSFTPEYHDWAKENMETDGDEFYGITVSFTDSPEQQRDREAAENAEEGSTEDWDSTTWLIFEIFPWEDDISDARCEVYDDTNHPPEYASLFEPVAERGDIGNDSGYDESIDDKAALLAKLDVVLKPLGFTHWGTDWFIDIGLQSKKGYGDIRLGFNFRNENQIEVELRGLSKSGSISFVLKDNEAYGDKANTVWLHDIPIELNRLADFSYFVKIVTQTSGTCAVNDLNKICSSLPKYYKKAYQELVRQYEAGMRAILGVVNPVAERGEIGNDTGYDESVQDSKRYRDLSFLVPEDFSRIETVLADIPETFCTRTEQAIFIEYGQANLQLELHFRFGKIKLWVHRGAAKSFSKNYNISRMPIVFPLVVPVEHLQYNYKDGYEKIVEALWSLGPPDRGEIGHDTGYDESVLQESHVTNDDNYKAAGQFIISKMGTSNEARVSRPHLYVWFNQDLGHRLESAGDIKWNFSDEENPDLLTSIEVYIVYGANLRLDFVVDLDNPNNTRTLTKELPETLEDYFRLTGYYQLGPDDQRIRPEFLEEVREMYDGVMKRLFSVPERGDIGNDTGYDESTLSEALAGYDESIPYVKGQWIALTPEEIKNLKPGDEVGFLMTKSVLTATVQKIIRGLIEIHSEEGFYRVLPEDLVRRYVPERGDIGHDTGYDESVLHEYVELESANCEKAKAWAREYTRSYQNRVYENEQGFFIIIYDDEERDGAHIDLFFEGIGNDTLRAIELTLKAHLNGGDRQCYDSVESVPRTFEEYLERYRQYHQHVKGEAPWIKYIKTTNIYKDIAGAYEGFIELLFPVASRGEIGHDTGYDESVRKRPIETVDLTLELENPKPLYGVSEKAKAHWENLKKLNYFVHGGSYGRVRPLTVTRSHRVDNPQWGNRALWFADIRMEFRTDHNSRNHAYNLAFEITTCIEAESKDRTRTYSHRQHRKTVVLPVNAVPVTWPGITMTAASCDPATRAEANEVFKEAYNRLLSELIPGPTERGDIGHDDGYDESIHLEGQGSIWAIVSVSTDYGATYPDVGMNNQLVISHLSSVQGVIKRAREYARDKFFRIQFHSPGSGIYREPYKTLTFQGRAPIERGDIGHDTGYDESITESDALYIKDLKWKDAQEIANRVNDLGEGFSGYMPESMFEIHRCHCYWQRKVGKYQLNLSVYITYNGPDDQPNDMGTSGMVSASYENMDPDYCAQYDSFRGSKSMKPIPSRSAFIYSDRPLSFNITEIGDGSKSSTFTGFGGKKLAPLFVEAYRKIVECIPPVISRGEIGHDTGYDESIQESTGTVDLSDLDAQAFEEAFDKLPDPNQEYHIAGVAPGVDNRPKLNWLSPGRKSVLELILCTNESNPIPTFMVILGVPPEELVRGEPGEIQYRRAFKLSEVPTTLRNQKRDGFAWPERMQGRPEPNPRQWEILMAKYEEIIGQLLPTDRGNIGNDERYDESINADDQILAVLENSEKPALTN